MDIATEFLNGLVFSASRSPRPEVALFRLEELSNEFGIGGIAFIAAKLLVSIGLDLSGIDEVNGVDFEIEERFRNLVAVVSGLFEASCNERERALLLKPAEEGFDSGGVVRKAEGIGLIGRDEVAEEFRFSDIDSEKEFWSSGGILVSYHIVLLTSLGKVKTTRDGKSQSHQNRLVSGLRCCSDLKVMSAT